MLVTISASAPFITWPKLLEGPKIQRCGGLGSIWNHSGQPREHIIQICLLNEPQINKRDDRQRHGGDP